MKIAIAYHSGSGHTRKLAECIKIGAELHENCCATLINVDDMASPDWELLHAADAIVFGSPTYMGSASGPFKSFIDATSAFWLDYKWNDKIAAGFTVGSGPSGDKLNTLVQMAIFAAQHSMIWVGQDLMSSLYSKDGNDFNHDVSFLGFMSTASRDKHELIPSADQESARIFGLRIAKATARWNATLRNSESQSAACAPSSSNIR